MSAHAIYDNAPIGSLVAWSDGTPRPPERFTKKLTAWQTNNSKGRLMRKQGGRAMGNLSLSASFTLHEADFGSDGVIAIRVHRTFSLESRLRFTVIERPGIGSVRVLDRVGDDAELVHLARHRQAAEEWLSCHGCRSRRNRGEGGMTEPLPSETAVIAAPGLPGVAFGRSVEGFPVARVHDSAFAMLPARDGRHYLATGWKIAGPLGEWRRSDFYGHGGDLADEVAFRAKVLENAEHQREKKALGRVETHSRANTPWGTSQGATRYADGVECHSTAGHGGFKLSAQRNAQVHPLLQMKGGWYESHD